MNKNLSKKYKALKFHLRIKWLSGTVINVNDVNLYYYLCYTYQKKV